MPKPGTPAAMLERMKAIRLEDIAGDVAQYHLEDLRELNLEQMRHGKNNKGELFTPRHSQNPFFKTPASAMKYAHWKHGMNPLAPFDVPDFFINGHFYSRVTFIRRADTIVADNSASFADKIESTFKGSVLGLNQESKKTAWNDIIRGPLIRIVADKIGCDVGG